MLTRDAISVGADADLTQMLSHMHAIDQAEDETPVPLSAPAGAAPPPRPARGAETLLGLGVSPCRCQCEDSRERRLIRCASRM